MLTIQLGNGDMCVGAGVKDGVSYLEISPLPAPQAVGTSIDPDFELEPVLRVQFSGARDLAVMRHQLDSLYAHMLQHEAWGLAQTIRVAVIPVEKTDE